LLILLVDGLDVSFLYIIFFLLGIFASGIVVIGFTAAKELFPTQIAGTSTGMVNLFPFAGGALFQPLCTGLPDLFCGISASSYSGLDLGTLYEGNPCLTISTPKL